MQIDFPSLVDVRIVKRGDPSRAEATGIPEANGTSVPSGMSKKKETEDTSKDVVSDAGNQQSHHAPAAPGMLYFGHVIIRLNLNYT